MVKELAKKIDLMRPAAEVMQIERLGALRSTSLSFLRILTRKMMREAWKIDRISFDLDAAGYGEAVYHITTPGGLFTFVVFSQEIDDEDRSDRVISEKWDVTFALCEGKIAKEKKERLRNELPKQEFGRGDVHDLVWSRANKSGRMFLHVLEALVNEKQPDPAVLNEVGYLFRTTAVYGNGKFGIAPYDKIKENHSFSGAFQAQMFAVYMLRNFSFELIEHIAQMKNPNASKLHPELKRIIGTGNATGLGMVPFLVSHPKLLHQWIHIRETALARVKGIDPTDTDCKRFINILEKACIHFQETVAPKVEVFQSPAKLAAGCEIIKNLVSEYRETKTFNGNDVEKPWIRLTEIAKKELSIEVQELVHSLLIECYAERVEGLEACTNAYDVYQVIPEMTIEALLQVIKKRYSWAFHYNFEKEDEKYFFWYRSVEKEEPRIGIRGEDPGEDREMQLNIAEQVQMLHKELQGHAGDESVAAFLLKYPTFKGIVKRIQSLRDDEYSEIQSNLLHKNTLPIHLLKCKLAIFGAERFDPKSNRWVRITLFQGAPLVEEIGKDNFEDSWVYPQLPTMEDMK